MSVQCIYCQQIRAKNTSRQKQHLLECPGLQSHPNAPRPQSSGDGIATSNGFGTPNNLQHTNGTMSNGLPTHTTPMQTIPNGTSSMASHTPRDPIRRLYNGALQSRRRLPRTRRGRICQLHLSTMSMRLLSSSEPKRRISASRFNASTAIRFVPRTLPDSDNICWNVPHIRMS